MVDPDFVELLPDIEMNDTQSPAIKHRPKVSVLKKSGGGIPGRCFQRTNYEARLLYDSFEKSIVAVKAALRFPTRLGTKWPAQPHRIHIITREGLLGSGLDPDMLQGDTVIQFGLSSGASREGDERGLLPPLPLGLEF